jgi:hypothetical protein
MSKPHKSVSRGFVVCVAIATMVFIPQLFSVQAATFTGGMSKRDAPGPFAAAPIVQGKYDGSGTPDVLSFGRGSQISDSFYANLDSYQGSIVMWVDLDADDNGPEDAYMIWGGQQFYFRYHKDSPTVKFAMHGANEAKSVNLTAGTVNNIVLRWDYNNTLDGTNHFCITVNDTHYFDETSVGDLYTPASTINIGSIGSSQPLNGIIEGLTIYRRPLYDGAYGIDAGNGDEISLIRAAGAGKDPALVTGSWDIVFALPTNSSTGALITGNGEAWSHPHSSNLLYTDTTNTGGFMMNGTYTTDGWADEGTPSEVAALSASEKVFTGGYKTTSDAANEGIYYAKAVTAGDDWVIRALGHSDGTCDPKVILYDQTNGAEIGSMVGSTGSDRDTPDVYLFTGQAPAGTTELRVKLINTAESGTCHWHQVELLGNEFDNPSCESGAGDPWVPSGWSNYSAEAGDTEEENTIVHSGSASIQYNSKNYLNTSAFNESVGDFLSLGGWFYGDGSNGVDMVSVWAGDRIRHQYTLDTNASYTKTSAGWERGGGVGRVATTNGLAMRIRGENGVALYLDDIYAFELDPVSLTVTPTTEANSTENTDELRIDGRDTYIELAESNLTTTRGFLSFDYRPRHSAAKAVSFAETNSDDAYIFSLAGDADDYVTVFWDSANTVKMAYSIGGVTASGTWDATDAIAANSQYTLTTRYTGGGDMILSVDGTPQIMLSSIPASFDEAPDDAYMGSDTSGANQGDATFSELVFDSVAPSIALTALSPDPNNDNTPDVTGTATDAVGTVSTVEYQMDATDGSWTACTADDGTFDEAGEAFTCTPTTQTDGAHTMYVRATDVHDNTTLSGSESSDAFTIDTGAPSISLTALSPDPNSDNTPSVTGTATETYGTIANVQYQMDGTGGAWTACVADDGTFDEASETFTCTPTTLADGVHTMYVRATDSTENTTAGGSEESDAFTIDASGPTGSVQIDDDATYTTDLDVTLTIGATDATTSVTHMMISEDSNFSGVSWETYATTKGIVLSAGDGTKTVYIKFKDTPGNQSSTYSDSIILDTTLPIAFDLNRPEANIYTSDSRPNFSWDVSSDTTAHLAKYTFEADFEDGTGFFIDSIPVSGTSDYETSKYVVKFGVNTMQIRTRPSNNWGQNENDGLLKEGKVTWKVTAVDNAGFQLEKTRRLYFDESAPKLKNITHDKTVSGTITDNLKIESVQMKVYEKHKNLGITTSQTLLVTRSETFKDESRPYSRDFELELPELNAANEYLVKLTGYDKAGNESETVELLIESQRVQPVLTAPIRAQEVSLPVIEEKVEEAQKDTGQEIKVQVQEVVETANKAAGSPLTRLKIFLANVKISLQTLTATIQANKPNLAVGLENILAYVKTKTLETHKVPSLQLVHISQSFTQKIRVRAATAYAVLFDPNPTVISNVKIDQIGTTRVVVSWETNHYTWGKVNYGKTLSYGQEVIVLNRAKQHTVTLTDLEPGQTYVFEVMSQGKNYTYDAHYTFETLEN